MKAKVIAAVAAVQFLLHWTALGILRAFGFHVFAFESHPTSFEPRILPIHMVFLHIKELLNYPLSLLPEPEWLRYSWFFTALVFAVNSVVWGTIIWLPIYLICGRRTSRGTVVAEPGH